MDVDQVDLKNKNQLILLRQAVEDGRIRSLKGEVICFTGKMSMSRAEMEALVLALGGRVSVQVDRTTTLLVASDLQSKSTKMMRARELGVRVRNMQQFTQLMAVS